MSDDKAGNNGSKSRRIEQILRERQRLDQLIQEKFRKKMSILFSDVCDYTQYVEKMGDITGRSWIQKHHDIVLPAIEKNGGRVLDIMGDGVMASFPSVLFSVRASVAIQRGLEEYNARADPDHEIHVKIGINAGEILIDEDQVAGDVVNTASRIQAQAGPDQILIAKTIYEEVCGSEDILCRLHGKVRVKGKAEPLELYRVVWRDEEIVLSEEPQVRAHEVKEKKVVPPSRKVLQLEIARENGRLKISAYEQRKDEVSTIRRYEEIPVAIDRIGMRCREIVETLNHINRKGRLTKEVLIRLREIGQVFRDELFSLEVKERIEETESDHLIISLDDQLVHVPWELLHDGKQFLCQRFNMGRLVKTRQTILGGKPRRLARPFKMLILADPKGDLQGAYQEGTEIRDYIEREKETIGVSFRSDDITPDFIRKKMRNFDFVHFAGHSDYNPQNPEETGWRLTSGIFTTRKILKMAGTAAMPALIFSNACQSARTEDRGIKEHFQDEVFGLANAFVLAGVKHYVGTFWEILDDPSRRFALEFYKGLISGMTVGEAMRTSRFALINEYGEEAIVWASYLLYGDPTFNYMDQIKMAEAQDLAAQAPHRPAAEPRPPTPSISEREVRAGEEIIDFAEKETKKKKAGWLAAAAGIIIILAFLFWGYPGLLREGTETLEQTVITHVQTGNDEAALDECNTLEEKNPQIRLIYVVRGNIYLRRGNLSKAEVAYERALEAAQGTNRQKAEAYRGLGRIASIRKEWDKAIENYKLSTEADPESLSGYVSEALVLEQKGQYERALNQLEKARGIAPNDQLLTALTKETRKKVELARDQERQAKIDRLVKELLESAKLPPRALPSDGWTSKPLTLWIMDFKVKGYSVREGEERLLVAGISEQVLQEGRVQLVERALLDRLLEELKLGTSNLIDRNTALSIGKILAARLILTGEVVHSGPLSQISLRLIETETGRISAAVNESFGSAVPVSALTETLSKDLLEKMRKIYPLRGKISEVTGDDITLNIGQNAGVFMGERFKVMDTDLFLEVISLQPDTCVTTITNGEQGPQKELRVEAIGPDSQQ